jgi:lipid II isoglutaminyl synthase (glutamine-hydrolysing)
MTTSAVRIGLLYPELLGTYGDRGNALVLERRLAWRGMPAELVEIPAGTPVPASLDVYVLGGGEDAAQAAAGTALRESGATLQAAREAGAACLAVCAGFQLLGERYVQGDGATVAGLGLIDAVTTAGTRRCVGECVVDPLGGTTGLPLLTGFENHAGRTSLGPGVRPLGTVRRGVGNGDGVDGAIGERLVATYLHGPVLARNPALADLILSWVAGALPPLDDEVVLSLRSERLRSQTRHLPQLRRRERPRSA